MSRLPGPPPHALYLRLASFAGRNRIAVSVTVLAGSISLLLPIFEGRFGWFTALSMFITSLAFSWLFQEGQTEAGSWALGKSGLFTLVMIWLSITMLVLLSPW